MVATAFELWADKWLFEMSAAEEKLLRLRYKLERLKRVLK